MMKLSHAFAVSTLLVGSVVLAKHDSTGSAKPPVPTPTTAPATMPAGEILDRMLQSKPGTAKPLSPIDQPVIPEADRPYVRKEGDLIRQRVGRLVRDKEGKAWEFHYEADGKTLEDPPMGVLPNGSLATMEATAKTANRDLRFRISGMVTLYGGRNYILIDRAEVVSD